MMTSNQRLHILTATLSIALGACGVEPFPAETSSTAQPGITMQGITMQGITMQGITMQGMAMRGYRVDGASLSGAPLAHAGVRRGELVAKRGTATLRGTELVGAHLFAEVRGGPASPATSSAVEYRITQIEPEASQYDPTQTGHTY